MLNKEEIARQYSPLALAYLGDGVYELFVRAHILRQGNCQNHKLHEKAKDFVSCAAQERFLNLLWEELTEREQEIVRRGEMPRPIPSPAMPTTVLTTPPPALKPFGGIYIWQRSRSGWSGSLPVFLRSRNDRLFERMGGSFPLYRQPRL